MQTITFTCETITPMFLSGADGTTPELRAPSIKGALRFWWRAMNGHLPLQDIKDANGKITQKGLKTIEGEIFGDTAQRSSFAMRIIEQQPLQFSDQTVLPHKERSFSKKAFKSKQQFDVVFYCRDGKAKQLIENLFPLCCVLGGVGGRMRRGSGSLMIVNGNYPTSLPAIKKMLDNIVPNKFVINQDSIMYLATLKNAYPYIESITIGRANASILKKIGQATHDANQKYGRSYGNAVGSANPRFASPVYVSVLQTNSGQQPIVTTLHHPNTSKQIADIQTDFKTQLLK